MMCYDYDNERWVTGREGAKLRQRQLTEERGLVASDKGAEYLRFSGNPDSVADTLAIIDTQLAECAAFIRGWEFGLEYSSR